MRRTNARRRGSYAAPHTCRRSPRGKSSLGDAESSLCDAKCSLGDATSSLGDTKSSLCEAKSSLGDAKSSLGDATSSLGEVPLNAPSPPARRPREGWTHEETIESLVRKAGFDGALSAALKDGLKVTRYQSSLCSMHYEQYQAAAAARDGA
jgi:hypothetical protein